MAEIGINRVAVCKALAAQGLLGTLGIFLLEADISSQQAVFWRCVFGAAFLTAYCSVAGYFRGAVWTRKVLALAIGGGVCMVLNWVLFFEAIRLTWIGFATITYHIQPFWIVLVGIFVMKEAVSAAKLGWIALAFVGFLLALDVRQIFNGEGDLLLGAGFAVLASLFYTVTIFATRSLGSTLKPHLVAWVHTMTGIVILAPLLPLSVSTIAMPQWGWLAGLGIIHTGMVYILLYGALPKLGSALIAVLIFVYPATALLVDLAVYGHGLDSFQCLGLLLIGCGTLGVGGALSHRKSATPPPQSDRSLPGTGDGCALRQRAVPEASPDPIRCAPAQRSHRHRHATPP
ncbi:MAG: EamA family transporter [Alphaproteobacteria bacterium]|nr:EamA family transporter [Alphaproteobacteria bacterium]